MQPPCKSSVAGPARSRASTGVQRSSAERRPAQRIKFFFKFARKNSRLFENFFFFFVWVCVPNNCRIFRGFLLSQLCTKNRTNPTLELFRANWKNLMQPGPRSAGLRCDWTPVDARDHAGPATLDSHGGGATRRLGVTGP